ncbi:hypothetical protein Pla52o_52140 [Novipirellula galeiformis]|uniref:Uncharacterized protein n=1 Tax=Novipirellula galeiformis TaxID=2528004 RepID=A0A5C6BYK3_9BACT|nr:hypothetical protein Pla52o_52140 [Novipirellula galeiformis]
MPGAPFAAARCDARLGFWLMVARPGTSLPLRHRHGRHELKNASGTLSLLRSDILPLESHAQPPETLRLH